MADASKSKIDKKAASKRSYKCVVPSCGYFAPSGFFSFPSKDEAMKKVWLDKLGLAKVDKNSLLCAQHFHSDHITPKSLNTQRPRLKIGAVPTLNLPMFSSKDFGTVVESSQIEIGAEIEKKTENTKKVNNPSFGIKDASEQNKKINKPSKQTKVHVEDLGPDLDEDLPKTVHDQLEKLSKQIPIVGLEDIPDVATFINMANTNEDPLTTPKRKNSNTNEPKIKKAKVQNDDAVASVSTDREIPKTTTFESDHNYTKGNDIIDDYEAKLDALKKQFQKEREEQKALFLEEKKKLKQENLEITRKMKKAERDLKNMSDKTTKKGRNHIDSVVRTRLQDHFTVAQLDLILNKDQKYSKKWSNKDFQFAMKLKLVSPKALKVLRKSGQLPLPSNSTLKKKFSFMYVTPGYVHSSLEYLKRLVPNMKPGENLACLSFDEMKIDGRAEYDRKMDAVLGPHKQAQTFMVRSLIGKWKFPVYVDFDTPVTKSLLLQVIFQLEMIGIKVLITTCDQAGSNQAVAKSFGIFPSKKTSKDLGIDHDPENVTFTNPWDNERQVFFSYDFVHAFKNLRNHLLDDTVEIEDGVKVNKTDLLKLQGKTEVRGAWKLEDIHFYCKKQDRQNVQLARDLISNRSAMLMKALYPEDYKMHVLSEFFVTADECFKILTSQKLYDDDPYKCALEVHLEQQLTSLEKLDYYMNTMKWSGAPRFNKAIQISMRCAIGLQELLATKYDIPYLMTENHTQDYLEAFFSVIRGMMAANTNPTAKMFLQRVKFYVIQQILEDENFDIFSLQEVLEKPRDLFDMDDDVIKEPKNHPENDSKTAKSDASVIIEEEAHEDVLDNDEFERLRELKKKEKMLNDPSYHIGNLNL